jgi:hypothetical protein
VIANLKVRFSLIWLTSPEEEIHQAATTNYWVRGTNAVGTADSTTAVITVHTPPATVREIVLAY